MEDIRVYDWEFNLLHIEHDVISSNWTIYYNNIGTWEGHFNLTSAMVPIAMNSPYLIITQGTKQAIITGKQAAKDCALYGRTVNWILSRRTIPKFKTTELSIPSKDVESITHWMIQQAFSDMDNFVLGNLMGFSTQQEFWRNTTNQLDEVIRDCLANDHAGHKVIYDYQNKCWIFQVLKGKTLDFMISDDNRNAYDSEYMEDCQNYYTSGWYERQSEDRGDWNANTNNPTLTNNLAGNYGKHYRVSTTGTRFGIAFKEGEYIVCRFLGGAWEKANEIEPIWTYLPGTTSGIYQWDAVLTGTVESEAQTNLQSKKWEKTVKAKVRSLKYGLDYDLGDLVRLKKQAGSWQTIFERRITGINIWYENNTTGEQPIFEEAE